MAATSLDRRLVALTCARHAAAAAAIVALCIGGAAARAGASAPGPHLAISSLSHPMLRVGGYPTGIAIDTATNSLYVGDETHDNLGVLDGASCDATTTLGCSAAPHAANAGANPVGSAVDDATGTLYVANNASDEVDVLSTKSCNHSTTSSCKAAKASVRVGTSPEFLAVDASTDTIYVANIGSNSVSVISGARCRASSTAGCERGVVATIPAGPEPFAIVVDASTDTVYVTDDGSNTVSVIDGAACNATHTSGCAAHPRTMKVGGDPAGIALDAATDTLYVSSQTSDDLSVLDTATCDATVRSGCAQKATHVLAGNEPRGIGVDSTTDTVYVADEGSAELSVIDGATCNAHVRTGCAQAPATAKVGLSPRNVVVDATTNSVYVTDALSDAVTMVNGRTCSSSDHLGC